MLFNKIFSVVLSGMIFTALSFILTTGFAQPANFTLANTTIVSSESHSATSTLTLGPEVNINQSGSLTVGAPNVYILPRLNILSSGQMYIVTSPVDVSNDQLLNPFGLDVSQAYPNPFSESLHIDFTLEKPGKVNIQVYDAVGKAVKTLVSESRLPGSHQIRWDGTSNTGSRISNGIYYIRFTTENYYTTQKAVFMK